MIKIGAKVLRYWRTVALQMAEVAIPRKLFAGPLRLIAELLPTAERRLKYRRRARSHPMACLVP
ncbi:MAG: hypothetical protein ACLQIQ_03450 [Beijerinckiaceae bacterium]